MWPISFVEDSYDITVVDLIPLVMDVFVWFFSSDCGLGVANWMALSHLWGHYDVVVSVLALQNLNTFYRVYFLWLIGFVSTINFNFMCFQFLSSHGRMRLALDLVMKEYNICSEAIVNYATFKRDKGNVQHGVSNEKQP